MSVDALAIRAPFNVEKPSDLRAEDVTPVGPRDKVVARIEEIVPDIAWEGDLSGWVWRGEGAMKIDLGNEDPVRLLHFETHRSSQGGIVPIMAAIVRALGLRLIDMDGGFFDPVEG